MNDFRYVGKGRCLVGIPTTDLSFAAIATLAARRGESAIDLQRRLIASGLYMRKK